MINVSGGVPDALGKGRWKRGMQRKSPGGPKKAGHFCPAITETQSTFFPALARLSACQIISVLVRRGKAPCLAPKTKRRVKENV